jgi:hypothetical protein
MPGGATLAQWAVTAEELIAKVTPCSSSTGRMAHRPMEGTSVAILPRFAYQRNRMAYAVWASAKLKKEGRWQASPREF